MLIGVGSLAGACQGVGGAIAGQPKMPSPIAASGRSVDIAGSGVPETSQGRGATGYVTGEARWLIDPPPRSQASESPGPLLGTDKQLVDVAGGWTKCLRHPVTENGVSDRTDLAGMLR